MSETPTFLMTDSSHFEVSYKINPWMTPEAWRRDEALNRAQARDAQRQLAQALRQAGARVTIMDGVPGLPDMVFPANAAVVLNGRALVSRFRYYERQGEERHFFSQFMRLKELGLLWRRWPGRRKAAGRRALAIASGMLRGSVFWAGFGPRSSFEAIAAIKDYFGGARRPAGAGFRPILPPRYLFRSLERRRNSLLSASILEDVAGGHQGPGSGRCAHRGER